MMDDYNLSSFMSDLIRLRGEVPEQLRLLFFANWARFENTGAQFNPLATTQPGGENPSNPLWNPEGVRNYESWARGVAATYETLTNGRYNDILAGLDTATVTPNMTAELRVWGTIGYADWIDAGNDPFRQDMRGGGQPAPTPTPAPPATNQAEVNLDFVEFRAALSAVRSALASLLGTLERLDAAATPPPEVAASANS